MIFTVLFMSLSFSFSYDLESKVEAEKYYEEKMKELLSPLGEGTFIPTVNVEFDNTESISRENRIIPDSKVEMKLDSRYLSEEQKPTFGGIPGTDSQIAQRLPLLRRYIHGTSKVEERKKVEYAYSREMKLVRKKRGIKKISASVILEKRHSDKEDKVRELMWNALGLDGARGDSISVSSIRFSGNLTNVAFVVKDMPVFSEPPDEEKAKGLALSAYIIIALAICIIWLIVLVRRKLV